MLTVPVAGPGEVTSAQLPAELLAPAGPGETWLTITAELAADTAWAPSGHVVASAQFDRSAAPAESGSRPGTADVAATGDPRADATVADSTRADGTELVVGGGVFDPASGRLLSLHGLPVDGPRLELWRGPTDNDRSEMRGSYELGDPDQTGGEGAPGPSSEKRWRDRGLDRLTHRLLSLSTDRTGLVVRVRSAAAAGTLFVDTTYTWSEGVGGDLGLRVEINPSPAWDCTWPRVGVRFDLPTEVDRAAWFGTGPLESYPDTDHAARVGRFAAGVDELNVVYSRPQETGHRAAVRELELADSLGIAAATALAGRPRRPAARVHPHPPHAPGPRPRRAPVPAADADSQLPVPRRSRPRRRLPRLRHRRPPPTRPLARRPPLRRRLHRPSHLIRTHREGARAANRPSRPALAPSRRLQT